MTTYQLNTSGDLELNFGASSALKLNAPLGLAYGGLGCDVSTAASTARSNLGVAIGTDVQAYNANLNEFGALTKGSSGQVLAISAGGAYEYATANTYTASSGLSLSAGAFSAVVDGSTVDVNGSNQIEIKAAGVSAAQLATGAVDGTTLQGGAGTALSIKALPNNSVTASAIASAAVGTGLTGGAGTAVAADNSVLCFLSGNQTVAGIKTFSGRPVFEAGEIVQPSGNLSYGAKYQYELKTSDALAHALATIGTDTGALMKIQGSVVGVDSTGAVYCAYNIDADYTNVSGTVTALNSNVTYLSNSDTVHMSVSLAVSSTSVLVNVQQSSSTVVNMRWSGVLYVNSCALYA